jgi:hypothetical protein
MIMDKLVKLDDVFEVIDKHIKYHNVRIEELKESDSLLSVLGVNDSACAIASLKMLKRELSGEIVY